MNALQLPPKFPTNVMWFSNGMATVFDADGQQMGDFQGRHEFTYQKLIEVGVDWTEVTTFGMPHCNLFKLPK